MEDTPTLESTIMLDYDTIISEAMRLSVADQLRLIDQLAASVPDDQPPALSKEWLSEIERRSDEIDSEDVAMESWESIRTRVFREYGVEGAG
jgi:putative addiction module component (TIGR02574 family)